MVVYTCCGPSSNDEQFKKPYDLQAPILKLIYQGVSIVPYLLLLKCSMDWPLLFLSCRNDGKTAIQNCVDKWIKMNSVLRILNVSRCFVQSYLQMKTNPKSWQLFLNRFINYLNDWTCKFWMSSIYLGEMASYNQYFIWCGTVNSRPSTFNTFAVEAMVLKNES